MPTIKNPIIVAGGGEQPQLLAPTLNRSGDTVIICNPEENGNFVQGYQIVIDNVVSSTVTQSIGGGKTASATIITDLANNVGNHKLEIVLFGENFKNSEKSAPLYFAIYTITQTITNMTASSETQYILDGLSYTNTLTPASSYYIPSKITLTMGGVDISATNYNDTTGVVNIDSVDGNIVLTATADSVNKLRVPYLTLYGKELTMRAVTNASTIELYMNNGQTAIYTYPTDGSNIINDITTLTGNTYGVYTFQAKAFDSNNVYADSDLSNIVTYNIPLLSLSINERVLTISNFISEVTGVNIYLDGILLDTLTRTDESSLTYTLSEDISTNVAHSIYVKGTGIGVNENYSDKVLYGVGNVSRFYAGKDYYTTTASVNTRLEYFIVENNAPVELTINYDFIINTAQDVNIQVYINGNVLLNETIAMASGTTNHTHKIMFQAKQPNCVMYITATTIGAIAKTIRNLNMQLVGNGVMFLREMPNTIYNAFPINYDIYISRLQNNTCDYKVVNINTLDFSSNYTTLIQTTSDNQIFPYLLMSTSISQKTTTLIQFTYVLFNATDKYLYFYNSSSGTLTRSYQTRENYSNITQYICFDTYYDERYSCRFSMIFLENSQIYTYLVKGLWTSSPANSQVFNLTIRTIVQLVGATSCLTAYGVGSTSNSVFLMQDDTGTWRVATTDNFVSENVTCTLGVGTRASIALCPSLTTDATNVSNVYRVFMCSYGTWYAYYLRMNTNAITLLKTEIISGDYDQIIAGNSNIYFKIKNGVITPVVDAYLHSISEMSF